MPIDVRRIALAAAEAVLNDQGGQGQQGESGGQGEQDVPKPKKSAKPKKPGISTGKVWRSIAAWTIGAALPARSAAWGW